MKVIPYIKKLVEKQAKSKDNFYGYSAYTHHIVIVADLAKKLAKIRKADQEIAEIAAWLHDIASLQHKDFYKDHHTIGAKEAQKILKKINYPEEKIKIVCDAIYAHRGSKNILRKTVEAKCLADADAMAHFLAVYDLFFMVYVIYKMKTDEGKNYVKDKLKRSWHKLSSDARVLIKKEYDAAMIILRG